MKKLEYVWLDGYKPEPMLRSKVKVIDGDIPGNQGSDLPDWSFDGSSTQQAEGGSSDCILKPASLYTGPANSDSLVMCEVLSQIKVLTQATQEAYVATLLTNGGLVLSKSIFLQTQKTEQF